MGGASLFKMGQTSVDAVSREEVFYSFYFLRKDPVYTIPVSFGSVTKLLGIGLRLTPELWMRNSFDPANRNAFDPATKVNYS